MFVAHVRFPQMPTEKSCGQKKIKATIRFWMMAPNLFGLLGYAAITRLELPALRGEFVRPLEWRESSQT
jgi:hypothetical protein